MTTILKQPSWYILYNDKSFNNYHRIVYK